MTDEPTLRPASGASRKAPRTESAARIPRARVPGAFLLALTVAALSVISALAAKPAAAQEQYNFTASVLAGVAGSVDADPGDGVDHFDLQLGFNFVTQPRTQLGVRLGRFDLGSNQAFGSLFDADLTYATIAGEYRLRESFYESGLFAGLGLYRLGGTALDGSDGGKTAAGATVGVLGDFKIARRISLILELSGHYVDIQDSNLWVMGLAGVGFHFK